MSPNKLLKLSVFNLLNLIALQSHSSSMAPADNVIDFQPFKAKEEIQFADNQGRRFTAQLIDLNPQVHSWYLLKIDANEINFHKTLHLEVADSKTTQLGLSNLGFKNKLAPKNADCALWSNITQGPLAVDYSKATTAYTEICNQQAYIRNQMKGDPGSVTLQGANLLRDNLGAEGSSIIDFVKSSKRSLLDLIPNSLDEGTQSKLILGSDPKRPIRAVLNIAELNKTITPSYSSLKTIEIKNSKDFAYGEWYTSKAQAGVYVSYLSGKMINENILKSYKDRVDSLEKEELNSLNTFVAFDLEQFNFGWSYGTIRPGIKWSDRNPNHNPNLSGPDGFSSLEPLQFTGSINPNLSSRLSAIFCGGFQRYESVFKMGPYSKINYGTYYGFIDNGVILSHLNDDLVTFIVYKDGKMDIKVWTEKDNANLPFIKYARQNGVPVIETDPSNINIGFPGKYVNNWGSGNWSGPPQKKDNNVKIERSERAAICISEQNGKRFLIFGYFTNSTPNLVARSFQAYGCQTAMHLDMNAPHPYFGLISEANDTLNVENLAPYMESYNTKHTLNGKTHTLPRYIGKPDEYDFIFVTRK